MTTKTDVPGELDSPAITGGQEPQPSPTRSGIRRVVRVAGRSDELGILGVLAVMIVVVAAFNPDFLAPSSLLGLLRQTSFIAIMAFGMVFLVTMRDIDLSVGASYASCILVAALSMESGVNPWVAALLGVLVAVVMGLFNGVTSEILRIPVIIVTLGTLSLYRGLAQVITDGQPVYEVPSDHAFFRWFGADVLGVPMSAIVMVISCALLTLVYKRTRFGAQVRAIGSNPQAAEFSGVRLARVRVLALVLVGTMVGISGMLTLAYFRSADATIGGGYELYVIAAVVIGTTPLSGGRGTIVGALIGALIIQVIQSGLVFFGVGARWSAFATGAVILAAVSLDAVLRRRRARSMAEVG